jgi:hypothetical protein
MIGVVSRAPTIAPPGLWARLARLDDTAHVSVHSLCIEWARQWEVIIRRRSDACGNPILVRRRGLAEALDDAVTAPDAKGWAD